ncbi:Cytochrome P450 [Hibiscus syriacus]|uniref:Cytochrome P450 n=1 Tax=Hibiscus syriacus TaxID=106335 RepID=A0A6A2ZH52_HIBSY|nr:Cytochrome P450 [Hibiscus syriacus]
MCCHFWNGLDIGGDKESMKKIAKELDQVVEGWLQEHKQEHDVDTINKANTLALILAAEDTTSITMTWALYLLLNNYDAMHKVQHELNIHVGKDRLLVKESDTKNLVYLGSVIKETLRLYHAALLSLVHEAIEDCTVDGYQVSAGLISDLGFRRSHEAFGNCLVRFWVDSTTISGGRRVSSK